MRRLFRSSAVAPCRPSKPMSRRTIVSIVALAQDSAIARPPRSTRARLARLGLGFLAHLALDDLPLLRAALIDQQAADQMIVLVLHGAREQRLSGDLERRALDVPGPHARPHAPLDRDVAAGEGQTALVPGLGLVRDFDDLWNDEDAGRRIVAIPGHRTVNQERLHGGARLKG